MKVVKPLKVPILQRVVEFRHKPELHVTAMLGFPLSQPRALLDEMSFWGATGPALGDTMLDEGIAKSTGELLVAGRCFAPQGKEIVAGHVRVQAGSIDKRLAVIGDRIWQRGRPSEPKPFVEMPVDWFHAFGGKEFPKNPYGIGIDAVDAGAEKVRALPNVERYGALVRTPEDRPEPDCFLPMDMTFEQRRSRAGTFGFDYVEKYAPGLPADRHPTVYNAAPPDQWLQGFWRGDERIVVENMNATSPRLESSLPGLTTRAFVTHRGPEGERFVEIGLRCDTLWLFPTAGIAAVVFHGSMPIASDDAADIVHLLVACEEPSAPRPADHYHRALLGRLDKDKGALADLSDSDLMPSRSSGVAPNIDFGEIGAWVKSDGIARANAHRGQERLRQNRRAEMIAEGFDPTPLGLDEPIPAEAEPPVDDLDALREYMTTMDARIEEEKAKAEAREVQAKEAARAARVELGLPQEDEEDPPEELEGGPPTYRAQDQLQTYVELAQAAREAGSPNEDLERKLADPAFFEQLRQLERMTRASYLQGAHLMPVARPMTPEAAHIARSLIDIARSSNTSLAERDFTGADFRGLDLSGMDLRETFLEGADLRGADLSRADLTGAVLARADLRGTKLHQTKLDGANLGSANFEGASLDGASLVHAVLMRARVGKASFLHARFIAADLMEVDWEGADLSHSTFEQCTFLKSDLGRVRFTEANLVQSTFIECKLDDTDFGDSNLHKATFVTCTGERTRFSGARVHEAVLVHGTVLPRADFSDALLERSCLRTSVFREARFDRARMKMSDLSECDARGAIFDEARMNGALLIRTDLTNASLRGVNLTEAILSKAMVAGADFYGAQLTRADFTKVVGDERTKLDEAVARFTRFDKRSPGEVTS